MKTSTKLIELLAIFTFSFLFAYVLVSAVNSTNQAMEKAQIESNAVID